MYRTFLCAAALAVGAHAVEAQELENLKRRVEELEKRSRPTSGAMNPDISLILQGTAARGSENPDNYRISGFAPSGGEVGPVRRGFSLGESELVISSNIDPYFRGQLIAALTPEDEVEVEEAFVQTLALGRGFTLKGGRFLSGIGYQNSIHQHAWDFQDAPLAYKAFLGGRLNDDGVQVKWIAPTDLLVELGAEFGRGRSFPGADANRNRSGMWSLFGHVGGDVGANTAWRAGVSYLKTAPEDRASTDIDSLGNADVTQSFRGDSKLWIADFIVKYARTFKLQGEYFRRSENGRLTYDDTASATPQFGAGFTDGYSSRQSGWYLQGVYALTPRWRAGYRFDRLSHGTVSNGIIASGAGPAAADFGPLMIDHNPSRSTAMVDFSPSEFSRIRLQFARDKSRADVTDNQALLQFIFSLGAHGAHTF